MRITDLEDNLRAHIWARIHRGELTGSGLSRDAGFQQAHMSNFLNARRGLSPEAMDRLLDVLQVDVLDLADPEELRQRALQRPERASSFDSVPMVSPHDAAFAPRVPLHQARDSLKFRKRFLQPIEARHHRRTRPMAALRLVKCDADNARAMAPRLAPGSGVAARPPLQFASSLSSRRAEHLCGAVRRTVRHPLCLGVFGAHHSAAAEPTGRSNWWRSPTARASGYIVGRVCHIAVEV